MEKRKKNPTKVMVFVTAAFCMLMWLGTQAENKPVSAVNQPVAKPIPAAPAVAVSRPVEVKVSSPEVFEQQEITLEKVLNLVSRDALPFKSAKTTLQKDDIRKKCLATMTGLLKEKTLKVQVTISNVREEKDGKFTITYGNPYTGSFSGAKNSPIRFHGIGQITVTIPREQALKIMPGKNIELTGQVVPPGDKNFLAEAIRGHNGVLGTISIIGDYQSIGQIRLATITWTLR